MKYYFVTISTVLLLILYCQISCARELRSIELFMTLEERIKYHGYPVELHEVITDDEYIIPLYHIPHGLNKSENENKNKSIVILVHGMGGSPSNYIMLGKRNALPYYFADRGFDVWLFSSRGNSGLPRQHKRWDWNENDQYWIYSYHQIGMYDLAGTIDYILNRTIQQQVYVIGHSAGGAEIYAMLSERPEYNKKVKCHVSMGSAPLLGRSDYSFMIFCASLGNIWKGLFKYLGGTAELLKGVLGILEPTLKKLCTDPDWKRLCKSVSEVFGSHRSVLMQDDIIEVLTADMPPRLSVMQVLHFMDNYNTGSFVKYDFGPKRNMELYGQNDPPSFNLSAVKAPSAFFIAPLDSIITKEDVYRSAAHLPNVVWLYEVRHPKFTHTDYILARNATHLVYEPLLKLFSDIDNGNIPQKIIINKNFTTFD